MCRYPVSRVSLALAATIFAMGLLAFGQPAVAKIVYTPANVKIFDATYGLDVNNDGTVDYYVKQSEMFRNGCEYGDLSVVSSNGVLTGSGGLWALALLAGTPIGPGNYASAPSGILMEGIVRRCQTKNYGYWYDVSDGYLGLQFVAAGKIHYGWARFNVQVVGSGGLEVTLTGYAYQTVANKPLKAGKM
jgi:hypothetical protein